MGVFSPDDIQETMKLVNEIMQRYMVFLFWNEMKGGVLLGTAL